MKYCRFNRKRSAPPDGPDQQILTNRRSLCEGKGRVVLFFRTMEKCAKTHNFLVSKKRSDATATAFFKRTIGNNGFPNRIVIDKSGSNLAIMNNINMWHLSNS